MAGIDASRLVRSVCVRQLRDAQSKQLPCVFGARGEDEKVFVLAHRESSFGNRFGPDLPVIGLALAAIKHRHRVVPVLRQPACVRLRQLVAKCRHEQDYAQKTFPSHSAAFIPRTQGRLMHVDAAGASQMHLAQG